MEKEVISTPGAPAAMGPYSQGIRCGNLLFLAGQVARDPAAGKLVEGGIAEQTRRVLQNLQAVLAAAGGTLDNVAKTSVFLKRIDDFAEMNKAYADFFVDKPPARTTIEAGNLPTGVLVEIDAIAVLG